MEACSPSTHFGCHLIFNLINFVITAFGLNELWLISVIYFADSVFAQPLASTHLGRFQKFCRFWFMSVNKVLLDCLAAVIMNYG
jgi:hypothetical protein